MPNYVLRLRRVIIHVDVGFRDPDTPESDGETSPHDLHPVGAGIAPYIDGATSRVCTRSTTAPGLVPRRGTVCAIQDKGDARPFPGRIQFVESVLRHLLHRARRGAPSKLRLREIPGRSHLRHELNVHYVRVHPPSRQGHELRLSCGHASV